MRSGGKQNGWSRIGWKIGGGGLSLLLSFAMVEVTYALNAGGAEAAGMISTQVAVSDLARSKNLQLVEGFLDRPDVQRELVQRGVAPKEAQARVASLSDFELQKVAGNLEAAPAGGDVIVISLTTVLLVIIILLLLGKL